MCKICTRPWIQLNHPSKRFFKNRSITGSPSQIFRLTLKLRANSDSLGAFVPNLLTGPEGKVGINFRLPHSLGTWRLVISWSSKLERVFAIASWKANYFGVGSKSFSTYLPFVLSTISPRYLNFGDISQYTVVLKNHSQERITISIALEGTNLEIADSNIGYQICIPSNKEVKINFWIEPIKVCTFFACSQGKVGEASIRVAAVDNFGNSDSTMNAIPVFTGTPITRYRICSTTLILESLIILLRLQQT